MNYFELQDNFKKGRHRASKGLYERFREERDRALTPTAPQSTPLVASAASSDDVRRRLSYAPNDGQEPRIPDSPTLYELQELRNRELRVNTIVTTIGLVVAVIAILVSATNNTYWRAWIALASVLPIGLMFIMVLTYLIDRSENNTVKLSLFIGVSTVIVYVLYFYAITRPGEAWGS